MKEFRSPLNYMWQNMSQRVFDFIRGSRKYVTLPAPVNSGETINLYVSAPETIVKFDGDITQNFNLNTVVPNAKLGDKLYIIMKSDGPLRVITSIGNLSFNSCGSFSPINTYDLSNTTNTIIPLLFDGTNFVGLDYC